MSYEFYKIFHVTGLLAVFLAYGLLIARAMIAGNDDATLRKCSAILSGIGLVLMLVSGFGMIAKLEGIAMTEWWLLVKYALWLVLGAYPVFIKRKPSLAKVWAIILLAIGLTGVIMGVAHGQIG